MPPLDVVIGQTIAIIIGVVFIGIVFADLFANKKSYIRSIFKTILARVAHR